VVVATGLKSFTKPLVSRDVSEGTLNSKGVTVPPTVAAVCPHCGWPEHDPDFIREEGVLVAVVMTCRRCGESSMLTWPNE
jgi:hypothetical protein